jgi:UDP:flavonoid glycosyltransferase YjiC (YdhE family)
MSRAMHARTGPEVVIRELMMPALDDSYHDLAAATAGADAMITGELLYVAPSLAEKTGLPWISTSLQPLAMFSSHDPNIYPTAEMLEYIRFMPAGFHQWLFGVMKSTVTDWFAPVKDFRARLGLAVDHDPIFTDKYSPLLHLAMFSSVLSPPQPDWPQSALQTGFCFYDEAENSELPPAVDEFLKSGEPPIVFTLGSAASLDPGRFFDESVMAAKNLGRRAIFIHGREMPPPSGLTGDMIAVEYAPYSQVFPRASIVVHQGGVGTTGQVLRAGVPHLIMPYSHDQPDNAARCRRAGVAEVISRNSYDAARAAAILARILNNSRYYEKAKELKAVVASEPGTSLACDKIEEALRRQRQPLR